MLGLEKRGTRRIPIHCPVQIILADGTTLSGMALDLSVDGILFECPIALGPAVDAEIRLQPPADSAITPLHAAIEVIRCDVSVAAPRFRIAAALRVIP